MDEQPDVTPATPSPYPHVVYRIRSSKDGHPEAIVINNVEDQKQFCKEEGLIWPGDPITEAVVHKQSHQGDIQLAYDKMRTDPSSGKFSLENVKKMIEEDIRALGGAYANYNRPEPVPLSLNFWWRCRAGILRYWDSLFKR